MLLDLINPENADIRIRECPENGVFISGLDWVNVDGPLECLRVIGFAEKNRISAFTSLNAHSSRSHSMLMVRVEKRLKSLSTSCQSKSKINLSQSNS